MGRKTFLSLPGALPGRRNIVLTKSGFSAPGVECVGSVAELLELLGEAEAEAFVIGGGEIYRQLLPYTDRVLSPDGRRRLKRIPFSESGRG